MKKHRHYYKRVGFYFNNKQAKQCRCGHVLQTGMTKWRQFVETGKTWKDYFK